MERHHPRLLPIDSSNSEPLRSTIMTTLAFLLAGIAAVAADNGSPFDRNHELHNINIDKNQNLNQEQPRGNSLRHIDMKQTHFHSQREQSELQKIERGRALGIDPRRYKNSWPECKGEDMPAGSAMTAEQCKQHVEHELVFNKLKNHVKVIVQPSDSPRGIDEVWIDTNRYGTVLGSNNRKDGLVKSFTLAGEEVGPWDCIGLLFDDCCDSILKTLSDEDVADENMMECHRNIVYPTATVDAVTDTVTFEEYVLNSDKDQIVLLRDPAHQSRFGNAIMPIFVEEGPDGKVHRTPYLQAKVINLEKVSEKEASSGEEGTTSITAGVNGLLSLESSTSGISMRQQSVAPLAASESNAMVATAENVYNWWMALPISMALFLVCCCCTTFYFLCCIPIKDENYLKETERVLEEANQKYHEKKVDADKQTQGPRRATSSKSVL